MTAKNVRGHDIFSVEEVFPGVYLERQKIGSTVRWTVYTLNDEGFTKMSESYWTQHEAMVFAKEFAGLEKGAK